MEKAQNDLMNNMIGAAPERETEIKKLWQDYMPKVVIENSNRMTLNANHERIAIDMKILDAFWLIGFSGWRSIETYIPAVIVSTSTGKSISDVLQDDAELNEVERSYKERITAAHTFIKEVDTSTAPWPPDIPQPSSDRDMLNDEQYKATFDLTLSAVAFTLFHEFRHVMLDKEGERPSDPREEELACDVWAREFLTAKAGAYATAKGIHYADVLQRRSMSFVLAALILHEITPIWEHSGNCYYFSVYVRMDAILKNTQLPPNSHFWNFAAAVLIGMCRQKNIPFDPPVMNNAHELTNYMLSLF